MPDPSHSEGPAAPAGSRVRLELDGGWLQQQVDRLLQQCEELSSTLKGPLQKARRDDGCVVLTSVSDIQGEQDIACICPWPYLRGNHKR